MHSPKPDEEFDHGLWFAVGAGISVATIAVAVATYLSGDRSLAGPAVQSSFTPTP